MNLRELNSTITAVLEANDPWLGTLDTETLLIEMKPGVIICETVVHLTSEQCKAYREHVGPMYHENDYDGGWKNSDGFDRYRGYEDRDMAGTYYQPIRLDGFDWIIGDGDDWLGAQFTDVGRTCRIWVRCWPNGQ